MRTKKTVKIINEKHTIWIGGGKIEVYFPVHVAVPAPKKPRKKRHV